VRGAHRSARSSGNITLKASTPVAGFDGTKGPIARRCRCVDDVEAAWGPNVEWIGRVLREARFNSVCRITRCAGFRYRIAVPVAHS